jgi:competence protein ComEC
MRRLHVAHLSLLLRVLIGAAQAQFALHIIDVGQADAILLEFKGAAILVDAGAEVTGDNRYEEHFLSDLDTFFQNRPDLNKTLLAVIVTHPHIDHTRLLMDVLQHFTVKNFYDGGDTKGSGAVQLKQARDYVNTHQITYETIRDAQIHQEGLTPSSLKKLSSGADLRFLAGSRDCANPNNNSLVLRVHTNDKTILLTGDSETDDDEQCDEGQVEHLLERYQGTDLLRADVYKVGHHGSHNGTDQALISAVSPAIAIITAGPKETRGPGVFHGFFFGHPREDVVELLEATAESRTPPISAYTYLKGTKDKNATANIIEGREITKAIYCTCWDGDVTLSINSGSEIGIRLGNPSTEREASSKPVNYVELAPTSRVRSFDFATPAGRDQIQLSDRERITFEVIFFFIPVFIYVFMRAQEIRRDRIRKELAKDLIERARSPEGPRQFTRFEMGALIQRSQPEKPILYRVWPKPRVGIDEVLEQAVAELIMAGDYGSGGSARPESVIDKLEDLHSHPNSISDSLGPLPSSLFLATAVPVVVLFIAIQAVPQVGDYLAGVFGHNSVLEELWTGLLASIVGTGATLLRKKSIERREEKSPQISSQGQNPSRGTTPESRAQEEN